MSAAVAVGFRAVWSMKRASSDLVAGRGMSPEASGRMEIKRASALAHGGGPEKRPKAAEIMAAHKSKRLPLAIDGEGVGVVTAREVVEALANASRPRAPQVNRVQWNRAAVESLSVARLARTCLFWAEGPRRITSGVLY